MTGSIGSQLVWYQGGAAHIGDATDMSNKLLFFCVQFFFVRAHFLGGRARNFSSKFPRVSGISIQRNVLHIRCEIAHTAATPVFFWSAPEFFLVDFHVLGGSTVKLNVFPV